MTDKRDPTALGELLLHERAHGENAKLPICAVYDQMPACFDRVPDYESNPSCIEKYGPAQGVKPE